MFTAILATLDAHVRDIEACLRFVADSGRVRSRVGEWLSWEKLKPEERSLVDQFLKLPALRQEVFWGSLFVSTYAGYEQCIGDIVLGSVDAITNCKQCYARLPEYWRRQNIYRSGQALATIMQPNRAYPFNYEEMAKNLGTCHVEAAEFKLNSSAFLINRGCLDSDTLCDVLKRIGLSVNWDDVAKHPQCEKIFAKSGGTRNRAKDVRHYLDESVARRNRLAHSPMVASDVTEEIVIEHGEFIRALCNAVASISNVHVRKTLDQMKATH